MKKRPILFSGTMVRALLDGSKTQTRHVVKPQPDFETALALLGGPSDGVTVSYDHIFGGVGLKRNTGIAFCQPNIHCPYGNSGDRLHVKEAAWMWCERRPNGTTSTGRQKWLYLPMRDAPIFYAAEHPSKPTVGLTSPITGHVWGWRLKIGRFLPAWASRIFLNVTDVRVERLNHCSEADAIAEGISKTLAGLWSTYGQHDLDGTYSPLVSYRSLWESINGADSWAANPWVWVVEFCRIGHDADQAEICRTTATLANI